MKAVVCQNTDLSVVDLPEPTPGPGRVVAEVLRCGICGSDLYIRHHCDPMKELMGRVGYTRFPSSSDPVVFGHEFCCEVLDYGPGCERKIKPGTRVVAQAMLRNGTDIDMAGLSAHATGAYAERMLLQEVTLVPVPNGLAPEPAALTEPMAVGWHAVRRSKIAKKDVAIVKEIDLRFVINHTPLEFRDTVHMIAEGKVNCAPMIIGEVGLAGVDNAFTALKDPEKHAKILVDPESAAAQPVLRQRRGP